VGGGQVKGPQRQFNNPVEAKLCIKCKTSLELFSPGCGKRDPVEGNLCHGVLSSEVTSTYKHLLVIGLSFLIMGRSPTDRIAGDTYAGK